MYSNTEENRKKANPTKENGPELNWLGLMVVSTVVVVVVVTMVEEEVVVPGRCRPGRHLSWHSCVYMITVQPSSSSLGSVVVSVGCRAAACLVPLTHWHLLPACLAPTLGTRLLHGIIVPKLHQERHYPWCSFLLQK